MLHCTSTLPALSAPPLPGHAISASQIEGGGDAGEARHHATRSSTLGDAEARAMRPNSVTVFVQRDARRQDAMARLVSLLSMRHGPRRNIESGGNGTALARSDRNGRARSDHFCAGPACRRRRRCSAAPTAFPGNSQRDCALVQVDNGAPATCPRACRDPDGNRHCRSRSRRSPCPASRRSDAG